MPKNLVNTGFSGIVENVDNVDYKCGGTETGERQKQISTLFIHMKNVDIVDNYCFKRFSPIFTTSPAPIVINRSPGVQFSKINF